MSKILCVLMLLTGCFPLLAQDKLELYNALSRRDYETVIRAIENGADPLSTRYSTGGRRTLFKVISGQVGGGGYPEADLLSMTLKHEQSDGKKEMLNTIMHYAAHKELSHEIWYLVEYLDQSDNLTDTVTLKWILNKANLNFFIPIKQAVEGRHNVFLNAVIDQFGWEPFRVDLIRAALCSDSTELIDEVISRFGVFPVAQHGIKAIDVLEGHTRYCTNDFSYLIKLLVKGGAKFDQRNSLKETITENAVRVDNLVLLKQLSELTPASFQVRNSNGQNLLHLAAPRRDLNIMQFLIDMGVALEARDAAGKYPHDYAYDWDLVTRKLLGDELTLKELNTLFLTNVARWPEESLSIEERSKIKQVVDSDEFDTQIVVSDRSDIRNEKLEPNYKDLIEIAEENRSWSLFAALYSNKKWKYSKPTLYYGNFYEANDTSFFRNMIPLQPEIGEDLLEKMANRWEGNSGAMISTLLDEYFVRKEEGGKVWFEDPVGNALLNGQRFNWIGGLQNGFAIAAVDGKYGIVTVEGEELVSFDYDTIYASQKQHQYMLQKTGEIRVIEIRAKSGFEIELDAKLSPGEQLIEKFYTNRNAYYIVAKNGQVGLRKQFIKSLSPYFEIAYDEIRALTYSYIGVRKGNKWAVAYMGHSKPKLKFKYEDVEVENETVVKVLRKGVWSSFR